MEVTLEMTMNVNNCYEAGMAPPIGGVESGGSRSDFSFADMAAISGSWVSYIFTNLANFRTPENELEPRTLREHSPEGHKGTD